MMSNSRKSPLKREALSTEELANSQVLSDDEERDLTLPVLPVQDISTFPGLVFPIHVETSSYILAIEDAVEKKNGYVALMLQLDDEEPTERNISEIGTYAKITHSTRLPTGDYKIRLHVYGRVRVTSYVHFEPWIEAEIEYLDDDIHIKISAQQAKMMEDVRQKFATFIEHEEVSEVEVEDLDEMFEPGILADFIATYLPLDVEIGQEIIKEQNQHRRLHLVGQALNAALEELRIKERIFEKASEELGKGEQEDLLREQLRQIQQELGVAEDYEDEIIEFQRQIAKLRLPAIVKKEAGRQLRRLQLMHFDTSEAAVARTYLSWITDLPWSKRTRDRVDLEKAKEILDFDHHGLDKTKERILDFLGVRKLRGDLRGPILLLVGPPGVGKTSLGRSIARALGRKFVRISLGGVRDEAEIRGHRRTYVGAMPGRILQGLKTAGSKNPVMMLDEIDKVGSDFRGDPSSVLLEVLDPEQNKSFEDHYLNVPFDLSEVMFIATANVTDTIPSALRDRMEVIEISGYTTEEKVEICNRYLVPQEKEENGLKDHDVSFQKDALLSIIHDYTEESGVRELRRTISTVFRKIARMVAETKEIPQTVTPEVVENLLGPQRYFPEKKMSDHEVGVVTGLAWTEVGGQLLTVEAALTKGKGTLSLTGQLGEVMQESAKAALTYVLSHSEQIGFDEAVYERSNIHIHVPHGAIPKDGPSAGIAIATALVSLFTGRRVSRDVAMTGEITLRGRVIPIGGLKEKALAARRAGIPTVVIPKENEVELQEFPKYLLEQVTFIAVETISEVLRVALVDAPSPRPKRRGILRI